MGKDNIRETNCHVLVLNYTKDDNCSKRDMVIFFSDEKYENIL